MEDTKKYQVINFEVRLNITLPKLLEEIRNFVSSKEPTNFGESVVDIHINYDDNLILWCATIYFFGGE